MSFDPSKLLYCIPAGSHRPEDIMSSLVTHKEVKFISLVGFDVYGNDTDEKIPVGLMLSGIDEFLDKGVQTDGSSVYLPGIADISDARVDLIPDKDVNWYVDYNYQNIDPVSGLPVGTLRIPAFLVHSGGSHVGSRVILRDAVDTFKKGLITVMAQHPYIFEHIGVRGLEDIADVCLTAATELEFYVKTPHEDADKERLHASQEMKEQYWKRTLGPVRTAMERTLEILDLYGFEVEMGHKEVGGVKAQLAHNGDYDHIMEQLEIDWKYSSPLQAADNDRQIRYIVKDVFREYGLEVSFMAKPVLGVAGSGKHTHFGVAVKLNDGRRVNLFTAKDSDRDYLSPIGFGALMGLLKNYEVMAPFVAATNDSFNRLKPGFEAPVCVVTSLGHSVDMPSRNRTVLVGLIRDRDNGLATRFELRSPNPKSNTHLVLAAGFMAMLDGIRAALEAEKTPQELCESVSKAYGDEDFYLDTDRIYRAENNIFEDYSAEDRLKLFGKAPKTVWECISAFDEYPDKVSLFFENDTMTRADIDSYRTAVIDRWASELHDRIIAEKRAFVRSCVRRHDPKDCCDLDQKRWGFIDELKKELIQDTSEKLSLLSALSRALEEKNYGLASELQLLIENKTEFLESVYGKYTKNLC